MKSLLIAMVLPSLVLGAIADSIASDPSQMGSLGASEFAKGIKLGWNVGNSFDAVNKANGVYVPGETNWGNPKVTQELIDSVKSAGFDAIRLPVAWSKFTDSANFVIDTAWLARVQQVVDYAIGRGMHVMLNEHWDGGWADNRVYADSAYANRRLRAIWRQVGKRFRDYGPKLILAGTNEVRKDNYYGTPSTEALAVQMGFNQVFVNTIRSTGGRNAYRYLVVQAYNTNIDHAVNYLKMPRDPTVGRLMVEVHFYDPYEFTISTEAAHASITQWGATAASGKKASWGDESTVDAQFAKMKTNFGDKGVPVLIGEYGCILKNSTDNPAFRVAWGKYVTASATKAGLIPFYWDNGGTGANGMGLFDRNTGKQAYPDIVKAMVAAAGATASVKSSEPVASGASAWMRDGKLFLEMPTAQVGEGSILDAQGRVLRAFALHGGVQTLSVEGLGRGLRILVLDRKVGGLRLTWVQTD